jgi:hypothetical protein
MKLGVRLASCAAMVNFDGVSDGGRFDNRRTVYVLNVPSKAFVAKGADSRLPLNGYTTPNQD